MGMMPDLDSRCAGDWFPDQSTRTEGWSPLMYIAHEGWCQFDPITAMEILYRHNKQSQLLVVWPTAASSQIPLIARRNFRRDKKRYLCYLVATAIAVAFPSIDFWCFLTLSQWVTTFHRKEKCLLTEFKIAMVKKNKGLTHLITA